MNRLIEIQKLVSDGKYRLTLHAELERDADKITISEIEEAFSSQTCIIIEDYPEDQRGHSSLLLGFTGEGKPIHLVCSIHEGVVVIITTYRPDPELWIDWKVRRK